MPTSLHPFLTAFPAPPPQQSIFKFIYSYTIRMAFCCILNIQTIRFPCGKTDEINETKEHLNLYK